MKSRLCGGNRDGSLGATYPPGGGAVVRYDVPVRVRALKSEAKDEDIYLCGRGYLAGAGLIDRLVLKVNPILLGDGVRLFGETSSLPAAPLTRCVAYESGVVELEYGLAIPDVNDNVTGQQP